MVSYEFYCKPCNITIVALYEPQAKPSCIPCTSCAKFATYRLTPPRIPGASYPKLTGQYTEFKWDWTRDRSSR